MELKERVSATTNICCTLNGNNTLQTLAAYIKKKANQQRSNSIVSLNIPTE